MRNHLKKAFSMNAWPDKPSDDANYSWEVFIDENGEKTRERSAFLGVNPTSTDKSEFPAERTLTRRELALGATAALAVVGGAVAAFREGVFKGEDIPTPDQPEDKPETTVQYVEVKYGDTAWEIIEALYPEEDTDYILSNFTTVVRQNGEEDTNLGVLFGGDRLKITYVEPEHTPEP